MDQVSLAVVTTAASTLAMEAGKAVASQMAKDAWGKVKSIFGWAKTPPIETLARDLAKALDAQPEKASEVLSILNTPELGDIARLASTATVTTTNNRAGDIHAGGDATVVQAQNITFGPGGRIGGR